MTITQAQIDLTALQTQQPPICGWETEISAITGQHQPVFRPNTNLQLGNMTAGFACALHMHQPTIPAGPEGALISHLQYMFEHPQEGDNHNAGAFAWCYGRMGEFIPQLVAEGCNPRIMLDYSGNLLWGLDQMGRGDILDQLRRITCDPQYQPYVEWLGTLWSHAVVPSTPIPDLKLHIQAWQHQFVALFGVTALSRVRGFSLPEMHLPNHPDTLYALIKALKECGYRWLMAQEHSVENLDGTGLTHSQKYVPNQLIARNSTGEVISMTVLIKTQGSDTKLVGQMQPYAEAQGLGQQQLGAHRVPSLVTQIADGENGGVMMNEFPRDFLRVWREIRDHQAQGSRVTGLNGTEYLELLDAAGVKPEGYPTCQAVQQHKLWQEVDLDRVTPESVTAAIAVCQQDPTFHMDGASWTNHLSWVRDYANVLEPMQQLSAHFHSQFDQPLRQNPSLTRQPEYHQALLFNLLLQTSCFRYWGQGTWTDYAAQLYHQGQLQAQ